MIKTNRREKYTYVVHVLFFSIIYICHHIRPILRLTRHRKTIGTPPAEFNDARKTVGGLPLVSLETFIKSSLSQKSLPATDVP